MLLSHTTRRLILFGGPGSGPHPGEAALEARIEKEGIIKNPNRSELRKMWLEHKRELGRGESDILRGLVNEKTGEHFWGKAGEMTHYDMQGVVDPDFKQNYHRIFLNDAGVAEPMEADGLSMKPEAEFKAVLAKHRVPYSVR